MTNKETRIGETTLAVTRNIRAIRKARGWSQRELAKQMAEVGWPLTFACISAMEANLNESDRRTRTVHVDDLVAFAKLFGIEPADLLIAPDCGTCNGAPPAGFTCQECGKGAKS
jgi:transcriptional regulator with XRE-family HTH domain